MTTLRWISRGAATSILVCAVVTAVAGCRSEPERSALARVPGGAETAALANADAPAVDVRRLWAGEYRDFYASSISPDGRYMSMVDWSTVDLAVLDLMTGDQHRITSVERGPDRPYEDAGVSVFSRDGRRIVVGWQYFPDLQLRLVDFETDASGTPRPDDPDLLFHNSEYYPYYPFDWSPDGSEILAKVYTAGNTNQLMLFSTVDGSHRALKSFDWREPTMAEFSPDGRYVAYDFLPDPDSSNRDVFVLSIDGSQDAEVVGGPAVDQLLGWGPDGSLLVHSDRAGTPGVWRVRISNGRADGPLELVRADMWGVEPLGFSGDRFYYGVDANPERLYTAGVDLESGRLTSLPVPVSDPARLDIRGWDWSPDGEFLAYSGSVPGTQGSVIGIRDVDSGEDRTIRLDMGSSSRLRWDPSGGSLIAFARDARDRRGFYRIDLETGTYSTILYTDVMEESTPRGNFALSPDGRTLYYARGSVELQARNRLSLVAHDIESGEDRHIADLTEQNLGPLALSPDGSHLVALFPGAAERESIVGVVPVTGGPVTELDVLRPGAIVQRLGWTPDGESIHYRTWVEGWIVPVDGAPRRPLDLGDHVRPIVKIHPDGRRVAFRAGESRGEVWVMEGLGSGVTTQAPEDSR